MEHFFTQLQFDLLYEDTSDLVFFLIQKEHSFEYLFVNKSAKNIFKENPIHKNLHDMASSSHSKEIYENYIKAIKENKTVKYQDFFIFSDIKLVNETTVKPIQTEFGQYILAITKEVSSQKKIEEEFLFMQSLLNMNVDPTIVITSNGKIFNMNPKFEIVFSCGLKEWRGKHYLNLPMIPSKERASVENHFNTNLQGKGKSSVLVQRMKSNEEVGSFLVSYSPIMKKEETIAMYILLQEVTDEVELKESLRSTRSILESYKRAISKAAIVIMTNHEGTIEYCNDLFEDITGFSNQQIIGQNISMFQLDSYNHIQSSSIRKSMRKDKIWRGELQNRTIDGTFYWGDTTVIPLYNEAQDIENILIIQFDITEKKNILIELQTVEKTFNLITENTNDLIAITDENGCILYISPSHEKILGLSSEGMMNKQFSDMLSAEYRSLWKNDISRRVHVDEEVRIELKYSLKNEDDIWTETSIIAVNDLERKGQLKHVIVSREITARKKLEEHLHFMAFHDGLTQLPNRSYLFEEFSRCVLQAELKETSIAVLFLDGDNFKAVNDSYGHDIGDDFIKKFAESLLSSVRKQDFVARIGGDEFIILLTQLSNNPAIKKIETNEIIENIKSTLQNGWSIKEFIFKPTTSIGISYFPNHGSAISELLEKADLALYNGKQMGKNRHLFYTE